MCNFIKFYVHKAQLLINLKMVHYVTDVRVEKRAIKADGNQQPYNIPVS